MARRFEHLMILLPWLHRNNGVSIEEAMSEFGRTEKELREDLTLLTLVGTGQYAMEQFDLSWHDGHIYVRDNLGIDRAFRFDAMETACLLLGLELLEQLSDVRKDFSAEDIKSLRSKLESSLPTKPAIHVVESDELDEILDVIGAAISSGKQLSFVYENVSRDDRVLRNVSPLRVISAAAKPVLQAWDHGASAWRSFRVEKINDVHVSSSPAELDDSNFQDMLTQDVRVFVAVDRLELLERFTDARVVTQGAQGAEALIKVAEAQWLARVCQAAGGAVTVLEPPEMVAEVSRLVAAASAAYN